jgi:hypothetical protein
MVVRMRSKGVTLFSAGAPPRRPVLTQSPITLLGRFIGGEESDFDLLAFQHIRNQRRNPHMPCVKRQIHRLGAKRKGFEAKTRQGANE